MFVSSSSIINDPMKKCDCDFTPFPLNIQTNFYKKLHSSGIISHSEANRTQSISHAERIRILTFMTRPHIRQRSTLRGDLQITPKPISEYQPATGCVRLKYGKPGANINIKYNNVGAYIVRVMYNSAVRGQVCRTFVIRGLTVRPLIRRFQIK